MAGVCAAILVAGCQDTAVELLTWPGRPRPAAIAITGARFVFPPFSTLAALPVQAQATLMHAWLVSVQHVHGSAALHA
jgi:hypothetical protein